MEREKNHPTTINTRISCTVPSDSPHWYNGPPRCMASSNGLSLSRTSPSGNTPIDRKTSTKQLVSQPEQSRSLQRSVSEKNSRKTIDAGCNSWIAVFVDWLMECVLHNSRHTMVEHLLAGKNTISRLHFTFFRQWICPYLQWAYSSLSKIFSKWDREAR